MIEIIFWISVGIVFYTYVGYGVLLYGLVTIKRWFKPRPDHTPKDYEPHVSVVVAAYNEKDYLHQKVMNTWALDYPKEKLHQVWVTDGSDDGSPEILSEYGFIKVLHKDERRGKIAAINRAVKLIDSPILIFTDANTLLGEESIRVIVKQFADPATGCVSGEKRIQMDSEEAAASAGEGMYWKYESLLKKWDSELNSAVGAAGELFAVRRELFNEVEPDTLLDDFMISLRIAMQGYTIRYTPEAYAIETASANVNEELKRKVRIAAGGIQSIIRLAPLLNLFKYKMLSFQYISHRVLRWTLTPLLLPLVFVLNAILRNESPVYNILFGLQLLFYFTLVIGALLKNKKIKIKGLYIPYYFFIMNYAVYLGAIRMFNKKQSVNWEKAKRAG